MQQEQKFTFKACHQLLQISPKSFLGWLVKAGIDPEKQRDRFDPRKKYLSRDQLEMLAAVHGRRLPPQLDDFAEAERTPVATVETLATQLDLLRAEMAQRFDQVDQAVLQLPPLLEDISMKLREAQEADPDMPAWRQLLQRFDQLEQVVREQLPSQQATPIRTATIAPEPAKAGVAVTHVATSLPRKTASTVQKKAKAKKLARGKKLPRTFVALRNFAKQHNVQMERASQAGKSGKIAVERGKWLVNSRYATEALDEQGRYDFYRCFHTEENFVACEQCPHQVAGSAKASAPTEAAAR